MFPECSLFFLFCFLFFSSFSLNVPCMFPM
jgi:hypothetical protein